MSYSSYINNKYTKVFAAVLIGLVCIYYVIGSFNWKQIWESLQKANLFYFFLGAITTQLAFFFFRTLRWQLLLKSENLNVPFIKLYLYNTVSIGISNITPFQSGEAIKVELLRKYGGARLTGYTIFLLEKFIDLLIVIFLGIIGVSFGFDFGIPQFYFYILAAVFIIGFAASTGALFLLPFERLNPVRTLLREKWQQKWIMLSAVFLTVCTWMIAVIGWKITLASVSIDINFLQSISLVSLTMLLAIISFVPGAVGVSEIGIATILTQMGIDLSLAQTGAIALRAFALILLALTFLHWIILKLLPSKLSARIVQERALF